MALGLNNAPLPIQEPIARPPRGEGDNSAGTLTDSWIDYFQRLVDQLNAAPWVRNTVSLTTQGASISATDFSGGGLNTGLYRITYYTRITRAATTSSSLTITFDWTDGGVSPTASGSAITGNTTTTIQSGTVMVRVDSSSPVRYATTYSSTGATSMQYKLYITLEEMVA